MKQRTGSSSLSALKLKSFSSLVKWWARIIHVTWKVTCLYGLCVNARTYSGKSLAVWMQQIWRSGNKCRNTLPVYFPESLCERGLCERKHVPGLIPGLIPGWDLVTLPGSVPERALCEQKPDQCRKGCVVVMTHFIVRLFYQVFWRQITVHTTKNM